MDYLVHHGILGQKWGDQNGPPYPLDKRDYSRQEKKMARMDKKYMKKYSNTITKKAKKLSQDEINQYEREVLRKKYNMRLNSGRVSKQYINEYNRELARLMAQKTSSLQSPSGKVVTFVAKRGEVGVLFALADAGYDMSQVKNGVWANSGRVAYKKTHLDTVD